MCACAEPDGSDIGAVYVECDGQTNVAEKNVDSDTSTQSEKLFQGTLRSYATRYEEAFYPWKPKKKNALRARSPDCRTYLVLYLVSNYKFPGVGKIPRVGKKRRFNFFFFFF